MRAHAREGFLFRFFQLRREIRRGGSAAPLRALPRGRSLTRLEHMPGALFPDVEDVPRLELVPLPALRHFVREALVVCLEVYFAVVALRVRHPEKVRVKAFGADVFDVDNVVCDGDLPPFDLAEREEKAAVQSADFNQTVEPSANWLRDEVRSLLGEVHMPGNVSRHPLSVEADADLNVLLDRLQVELVLVCHLPDFVDEGDRIPILQTFVEEVLRGKNLAHPAVETISEPDRDIGIDVRLRLSLILADGVEKNTPTIFAPGALEPADDLSHGKIGLAATESADEAGEVFLWNGF